MFFRLQIHHGSSETSTTDAGRAETRPPRRESLSLHPTFRSFLLAAVINVDSAEDDSPISTVASRKNVASDTSTLPQGNYLLA